MGRSCFLYIEIEMGRITIEGVPRLYKVADGEESVPASRNKLRSSCNV